MCTGGSYALTSRFAGGDARPTLRDSLKKLFSTPFCTYMLMLILAIAGISIPSFLQPITTTIGNANGFMAMLMVGTMFEFNPDRAFLRQAFTILLSRYVMAAAFSALFYFVLPFSLEVRQVLAIVAFCALLGHVPGLYRKARGRRGAVLLHGELVDPAVHPHHDHDDRRDGPAMTRSKQGAAGGRFLRRRLQLVEKPAVAIKPEQIFCVQARPKKGKISK